MGHGRHSFDRRCSGGGHRQRRHGGSGNRLLFLFLLHAGVRLQLLPAAATAATESGLCAASASRGVSRAGVCGAARGGCSCWIWTGTRTAEPLPPWLLVMLEKLRNQPAGGPGGLFGFCRATSTVCSAALRKPGSAVADRRYKLSSEFLQRCRPWRGSLIMKSHAQSRETA